MQVNSHGADGCPLLHRGVTSLQGPEELSKRPTSGCRKEGNSLAQTKNVIPDALAHQQLMLSSVRVIWTNAQTSLSYHHVNAECISKPKSDAPE